MEIIKRITSKTPKFFKKIRLVGLILASASAAVLATPVALPAGLVTVAGYVALAGGVMTAVSQTAVLKEPETEEEEWPVNNFIKKEDAAPD